MIENAELVLGRFTHADGHVHVEHAILAGTTMAAVEVQASVWAVAWAAGAFAHRLESLLREATPTPAAPKTPAALRRDAEAHVADHGSPREALPGRAVRRLRPLTRTGATTAGSAARGCSWTCCRCWTDSTAVRASSPVLSDIDLTDDLALELMRLAAESPFGCYSYQPARREVWFEHVILGDDLDRPELEVAIQVVAETADGQDDRWPGASEDAATQTCRTGRSGRFTNRMSAGRFFMWLISGGIVVATLAVLAGPGYSGVPGQWIGLLVAVSFASIAFGLGYYE